MSPFKLPFNGSNDGLNNPLPADLPDPEDAVSDSIEIFVPQAGGLQEDTIIYAGIVFNVPVGAGKAILLVPTLSGGLRYEWFEKNGASRMVAVPLTERGVWLYHVEPFVKGNIVIATSL